MAIYREDYVDIELKGGSIHRSFLMRSIGKNDNLGNRFGVRLFRDGVPVSLGSASCLGFFMAPDGTNIAITGASTGTRGNGAWVDLPQACYNVEGQFTLAIKVSDGTVTGTMRIVDGVVNNTGVTGAVAPTESVPTYQEILAVYDEMLESLQNTDGISQAIGRIDNGFSNVAAAFSYLVGRMMPEGTMDSFSESGMSGTLTSNKARKIDGTDWSGNAYCYTTYTGITAGEANAYVIVTGHSWSDKYPLILFYDENNGLIAYQDVKPDTQHEGKAVMIPVGTSYFVVNGRNAEGYRPQVLKLAASTVGQGISTKLSPYNKLVNADLLAAHADYAYVRNMPGNYIYQLANDIYPSLLDVPGDLDTYATLIKMNPNSSRASKGYTTYILSNNKKIWFGWDDGTRINWQTVFPMPSVNVNVGLEYITETSTTSGKARKKDGTDTSNSTYLYKTFTVSGGEELLISGYHFSNSFPLWLMYDSSSNLVASAALGNTGRECYKEHVFVPKGVTSIVVNGTNSGTGSGSINIPGIEKYNGETMAAGERKRRYLFIGDSYLQGYSHDGSNSGWGLYAVGYMGLTSDDYVRKYYGGARFSANASNNTFEALLKAVDYPYDYFTDIIVCGGYNDHAYTANEVLTGIENFMAHAKNKYPNAKVHIGFVAWNKAGTGEGAEANWETYHTQLLGTTLPAYMKCVEKGADYLNNVEYWINDSGITNSDGYHPSAAGNQSIGRAVANAILTGSAPLPHNESLRM